MPNARIRSVAAGLVTTVLWACATAPDRNTDIVLDRSLTANPLGGAENPALGYPSPQNRARQNQKCSLALAISGGGTVSASVAYGFLEALTDSVQSRLSEVDYISTASGGGHAAYLFVDMIREAKTRAPGDVWGEVGDSFRSPRFANSLSWRVLRSDGMFGRLLFAASGVCDMNGKNMVKNMYPALSSNVGHTCPAGKRVADLGEDFNCVLLGDDDILRPRHFADPVLGLPLWIPNVSIFHAGVNLPYTPENFGKLNIPIVSFSRDARRLTIPAADLDMQDVLVLSSAFPGIGPFVSERSDGTKLLLADGGQTDNLGIENAAVLVGNDMKNGASVGIIIGIDTSTELTDYPYFNAIGDFDRLMSVVENAVPLLKHDKRLTRLKIAAVNPAITYIGATFNDIRSQSSQLFREAKDTPVAEELDATKVNLLRRVGREMFRAHQNKISDALESCATAE